MEGGREELQHIAAGVLVGLLPPVAVQGLTLQQQFRTRRQGKNRIGGSTRRQSLG